MPARDQREPSSSCRNLPQGDGNIRAKQGPKSDRLLGRAYSGTAGMGFGQERPSYFADAAPHLSGNVVDDLQKAFSMAGDPASLAIKAHYMANGNWYEVFVIRMVDWISVLCTSLLMFLPSVLALMTVGVLLARYRVLEEPREHTDLLKMLMYIGLGIGLPLSALAAFVMSERSIASQVYWASLLAIGAPLQALAYLSLLLLWFHRTGSSWLKRSLTACGRMAMTNYLMHTVVFTTIFYGWGFGLFGRFGHAGLFLFAIPMWAFQLWFSPWWLARHEFGPLEWLWRWGTYGARPRLKRIA